jgi:hypothetical protein
MHVSFVMVMNYWHVVVDSIVFTTGNKDVMGIFVNRGRLQGHGYCEILRKRTRVDEVLKSMKFDSALFSPKVHIQVPIVL